jgi:hypothetical protein
LRFEAGQEIEWIGLRIFYELVPKLLQLHLQLARTRQALNNLRSRFFITFWDA